MKVDITHSPTSDAYTLTMELSASVLAQNAPTYLQDALKDACKELASEFLKTHSNEIISTIPVAAITNRVIAECVAKTAASGESE